MIIGGFDTANMPDIGYGYQQGGLRRWASRWIMRRATRLVTNSEYSRGEIERNTPIPPARVTVLHHGVPDPFGELPPGPKEPLALTVGHLVRSTLEQKGHRPFVAAAAAPSRCALRVRGPLARRRDRGAAGARGRQRRVHRLAVGRRPSRDVPARLGVRAGLAPRGLRPGGGRGDARRLRAGGDERDRDARGGGRRGGADRGSAPGGRGGGRPAGARARAPRPGRGRASGSSPHSPCSTVATGCSR